jgi:hypothetical protein
VRIDATMSPAEAARWWRQHARDGDAAPIAKADACGALSDPPSRRVKRRSIQATWYRQAHDTRKDSGA